MDGIDLLLFGKCHDPFIVEIGFDRTFAFADEIRLIGLEPVQGEAIFL
jgi:hypothetical protein